jgi:hypothetical protein
MDRAHHTVRYSVEHQTFLRELFSLISHHAYLLLNCRAQDAHPGSRKKKLYKEKAQSVYVAGHSFRDESSLLHQEHIRNLETPSTAIRFENTRGFWKSQSYGAYAAIFIVLFKASYATCTLGCHYRIVICIDSVLIIIPA